MFQRHIRHIRNSFANSPSSRLPYSFRETAAGHLVFPANFSGMPSMAHTQDVSWQKACSFLLPYSTSNLMAISLRIDTDHSVLELMEAAAQKFLNLQGGNIAIGIRDEMVELTGSVRCWSDKQRLQESIRSLAGRRSITNDVKVIGQMCMN